MIKYRNTPYSRGLAIIISIVLLLAAFTGCGSKLDGNNEAGSASQTADGSMGSNTSARDSADTAGSSQTSDKTGTADSADKADDALASDSGTTPETADEKFPLTVVDANGDEMVLQNEPQRIISMTLGSDEILFSLVDKSRIASLTRYADDEGISNIAAEAKGVAARTTMDMIENIIALNPDLVILDTWADPSYIKQLRDSGITVYAFRTPCNLDEQKMVIAELAHVVGADEKGMEIIKWMDDKLAEIEEKLSAIQPEQRLTVMDYGELGSSGKGTNFDDIVTRAGLINVVSRAGMEGWPVVSKEKIIEFNPDIIILPSWYYDPNNSFEGLKDSLVNDESLQTVNAIKNDRIFSVPNPHISAISQYAVLAVEDVARAAYPELFE
jgi:iron complex transport system substrate-binding protein